MTRARNAGLRALHQAFDDARFGPARTESWLRERQASRAGELLVITGRGNQSDEGTSPVRAGVVRLFATLRRKGVIASVTEHTPGSFVVLPAPLSALREAARRRRDPVTVPAADPVALRALEPATRRLLRQVAQRALEVLGAHDPEPFVEREMMEQFSRVALVVPDGPDREVRLRAALRTVLQDYDDV